MLVTRRGLGRSLGRLGLDPKYANPASGSNAYTSDPNRADPSRYVNDIEQSWDNNTSDFLLARWQFYKAGLDARINSTIAAIRDTRQVTTKYPWRSFVGCRKQPLWGWEDILTPPGVINVYGVPFALEELTANGKLGRTFAPTKEQRFLIDWAIYTKSQLVVAALIRAKGGHCGTNVDLGMDHSWGVPNHPQPTEIPMKYWRDGVNHASVRDLMTACDFEDLVTYLPGYSLNPIQPTADELNKDDGAMNWYLRGGYFLSKRVATGKMKLDSTGQRGLRWSVGYYLCPDYSSGYYAGTTEDASSDDHPTSDFTGNYAEGGVPAAALYYHTAEGKGWDIHVTLEHLLVDMATPSYTLRVTPTDVGAGQKILQGMAKIAEMMRSIICTLAPVAAPITSQQLLKETCADSFGKSCAKGTTGCVCTQPSAAQVDAVAVSQSMVSAVCAMGQEQPSTVPPPQTFPPPGPVDPQPWRPPWWMIALGGLGAGAFLFSRR